MHLFKKNKTEINSKYKVGERVYFKYKGDVTSSYVYSVYLINGEIFYSLQIGGECPAVIKGIKEENIFVM